MSGREGLGWSVVLFAALGGWLCRASKGVWVALTLAGIGIVFATGSTWFGSTSPFGLFNSICEQIVRPLTQPTRFLLLSIISLPLLVGFLVRFWKPKNIYVWVYACMILLAESFCGWFFGSYSHTPIPESDCIRGQTKGCPDLVVGWDDDERKDATLKSRWLQIAHERPAATIGTGSWYLVGTYFPGHHLREMGWTDLAEGQGKLDLKGCMKKVLDGLSLTAKVQQCLSYEERTFCWAKKFMRSMWVTN